MKVLIPESDNLPQTRDGNFSGLPDQQRSKVMLQFNLYLLSTFHAYYFGYKNKLTTDPQEVDSSGCRQTWWMRKKSQKKEKKKKPK